jgi:hypothetical protein
MADIFKINGADYECDFTLTNKDSGKEIKFSKSAVKGLQLEENIFEPFVNADIIINNPYDYIEKTIMLRGDGNDMFTFSLKLKDAPDKDKLSYDFIVNGETNLTDDSDRSQNYKQYSLMDINFFKLNQRIPFGKKYSGKVGDIIKSILKDVIDDGVVDEENWEAGDNVIDFLPESVIPASSFKYTDLIFYLLRIYYYKDGDIYVRSFLNFDRTSKKFTLQPISETFAKNKDYLDEAFGVGDLVDKFEANKHNPPPDAKVNVYTTALKNTNLTTPFLEYSNEFFVNGLVHGYDPILGEHGLREIRIKDLKRKWQEKFVDVFTSVGGKPKPFLVLNKVRQEENFKIFSFPFNIEKNVKIAEAEMTSDFTFYNLQLIINNLGNTKRTSARFIDIYKPAKEDGEIDRKLLGRWFVTRVTHTFTFDSYKNTILCVKTFIGPGKEPDDNLE